MKYKENQSSRLLRNDRSHHGRGNAPEHNLWPVPRCSGLETFGKTCDRTDLQQHEFLPGFPRKWRVCLSTAAASAWLGSPLSDPETIWINDSNQQLNNKGALGNPAPLHTPHLSFMNELGFFFSVMFYWLPSIFSDNLWATTPDQLFLFFYTKTNFFSNSQV